MKFPARDRVIYDPNPLAQVTCIISFPRNLAIDQELPVSFQKAVMEKFPLLETEESEGNSVERSEGKSPPSMVYEFHSMDKTASIALGSDFLGIRTEDYERWEKFRDHIVMAVRTLLDNYSPQVFTRIALNYVNVISREGLKLEGTPWRDLIQPALIGALADASVPEDQVEHYHSAMDVLLGDDANLRITTGVVVDDTDKPCFLIDNLFYSEKAVDANELKSLGHLNRFNAESGCVFQWCIKPKLHVALNPKAVD